jgi:hypothetical protein
MVAIGSLVFIGNSLREGAIYNRFRGSGACLGKPTGG